MRNRRISSSGILMGPLSISTKLGHQIKDPLPLSPGCSQQPLDRDRSRSPKGKLLSSDTIMDSSSRPSTRSNDRKPVPQSPSPSQPKRIQATTNNKLNALLNRQSVLLMGEAKGVLGMKGKKKTHLPYPSSPGMLAESDLRMLNMIARQVSTPAAALSSLSLSSGTSELGSNDRKRVQLSEGTTITGASTTTTQLQSPGFEFTDSIISSDDDDSSIKDIETSVMDYKRMVLESADQSFVKIKEKYNQLMKTISSQHRKEEAVSRRQSLSDNQGDNYGTLFGSLYDDGDDDGDVTYLFDETRTIDPAVIADDDAVDIAASSRIAGSSPSIIADTSAASPSTGPITPAIHHHYPRTDTRKKSVTFEVVAPHQHPHPHPPIDSSVPPSSMMMHSPMKKRVVMKQ